MNKVHKDVSITLSKEDLIEIINDYLPGATKVIDIEQQFCENSLMTNNMFEVVLDLELFNKPLTSGFSSSNIPWAHTTITETPLTKSKG